MRWLRGVRPILATGVALVLGLVVGGCGVTVTGAPSLSSPTRHQSTPPRKATSPTPSKTNHSSSTPSQSAGPTITLSGTLGSNQRASFSAWVGGQNASGQFVWVPVTVELDTGAPSTNVDGQLLQQYGLQSDGQTESISGFGSGSVTGYQYTGLTLVPVADPTQAIAANDNWYSGIGASGLSSYFQLNVGEDIIQQGHFSIQGQSWSFTYVPAETLSSPPSSSSPPPSSGGGGQGNPPATAGTGYLGVDVTNPPSDWTVTGCEVTAALGGSPAAQAGFIGSTQRTDPVGDVINQITDVTQGWGPIAVNSCAGLAAAMATTRPGDQVTLGYYHRHVFIFGSWVPKTVTVTLTAWPLGMSGGNGSTF